MMLRQSIRSTLALVVSVLALQVLFPAPAFADLRAFSAGSLIIPMDACHQAALDQVPPSYCVNGKTPDDGAIKAYGLVYLLLKRGFTLYLVTDPAKTAIDAIDLSLTRSGAPPVGTYNRTTRTFTNFTTATTVSYRGSPLVIDVGDAQAVLDLLATDPTLSTFTSVAIHVAYDSFTAQVAMRMNGVPPKVAVFVPPSGEGGSNGTEGISLMRAYLRRAGLDYPTAMGTAAAPGEIFDELTTADLTGGYLDTDYQVVWFPHYTPGTANASVLNKIRDFADAGGMVFAECGSIQTFEANSQTRFMTTSGISLNKVPDCYPGNTPGFNRRNMPTTTYTPCWDPKTTLANTTGSNLFFGAPTSPLIQIGDFRFYKKSGTVEDWVPASGSAWRTGLTVLMRSSDTSSALNNSHMVSTIYKDNDTNKGQIVYFGGHFYGDSTAMSTAGTRIVLNTLMFARPSLATRYIARSGPSMLRVGTRNLLFQGSYLENNNAIPIYTNASQSTWTFPQILGQFRAYDTATMTVGTQSLAADQGGVWNSAMLIPSASVRRVFTSRSTGAAATLVDFTSSGLATIGSNPFSLPAGFTTTDHTTLIDKVRRAQLGGIDHATAAVISGQTVVAGGATRPTVAYVGGMDGMLHAFMVEGTQATAGAELWSFLPGEQLGNIRANGVALDGSPAVGDIYEKIGSTRRWRTLLTVSQGRTGTSLYGLDVSDPLSPALLWHRGTTASGVVLGNSQGAAYTICPRSNKPFQSYVIVAGNKVGGGSGLTVTALSGADGSQLWTWTRSYNRTMPGTSAIIPNDIPAQAALVDADNSSSCEDRTYVADLDGRIWELNTTTGQNVNGSSPLADVGLTPGGRVQPIGVAPAIYLDRTNKHRMMAVVTGGMDWAHGTDTYALYTFDIDPAARQLDQGLGVAPRRLRVAFSAGYRGYAPPTVSGYDVYVLTSNGTLGGSIGATLAEGGTMSRINLYSGQVTGSATITKGAGGFLTTSDGTLYGATARDMVRMQPPGADQNGDKLREIYESPLKPRIYLEMP